MTEVVTDEAQPQAEPQSQDCPQPGCIRPYPHEGMRHRYAETKELKKASEPEHTPAPEPDERPFSGPIESQPRNHAISIVDNGLQVAWDVCARCMLHITKCWCSSGPMEPEYISRWRTKQFPINDPPSQDAVNLARQIADESLRPIGDDADEDGYSDKLDVDEFGPELRATDDPDYDEAEQQEAERNPLAQGILSGADTVGEDDDIDPEVGF